MLASLRDLYFRAARRITPTLQVKTGALRFHVSTSDSTVGRRTFAERRPYGFDVFEKAIRALELARPGFTLEGRTLVDVGANIGTTLIPGMKIAGAANAVAIEAVAENVRLLQRNLDANLLTDQVRVVHAALSDHDGTASVELVRWNPGAHRVIVSGVATTGSDDEHQGIRVPARRFDALVEDGLIELGSVGLVWMDVEGHEAQILAGATSLLRTTIPVVIEFSPGALRLADGLELLCDIVEEWFESLVDLGQWDAATSAPASPSASIRELVERYPGGEYTDLLLLPRLEAAPR